MLRWFFLMLTRSWVRLKLGTTKLHVDVLGTTCISGDEQQIDLGLSGWWQLDLGLFSHLVNMLDGHLVLAEVNAHLLECRGWGSWLTVGVVDVVAMIDGGCCTEAQHTGVGAGLGYAKGVMWGLLFLLLPGIKKKTYLMGVLTPIHCNQGLVVMALGGRGGLVVTALDVGQTLQHWWHCWLSMLQV